MAAENNAPDAQHEQIGVAAPSNATGRTTHPDAQWFGEAGLGLFLHWGISGVDGRVDLSWGMMAETPWDKGALKLTPEAYFKLAERFQPDKYDPDKWLKAAKAAGFRYAVLTTRHHDGFALWPSAYGEFSTKNYLGGRDLVKEYVEACRRNGLKVGLYYSPPDWYFNRHRMSFRYGGVKKADPTASDYGLRHEPITLPVESAEEKDRLDKEFHTYIKNQVEELLTRYGKIDLIWFDGGPPAISVERIRELQPGIVINPRMHGKGDFQTPEVRFPTTPPSGWWELCSIWNSGGWGYTNREQYRSTASVITEFVKVRAWGGNLLVNMGPRPNGELPEVAYERLNEFGEWIRQNGEAVFDVKPIAPEKSAIPATQRKNIIYLFALPDNKAPLQLREERKPQRVQLLGTKTPLQFRHENDTLTIEIPAALRTKLVDVVAVEF